MSYNRVLRKRAVVTGGGNGIGRAICRLFAREGADVAVMDINKDEAERTLEFIQYENPKKQHCVITGDVSKVSDIKKTLETAWTSFGGKPNVLVNNAGVVGSARHMDMVSEDSMNKVIDIDLKAVYLMAKYFIAMLKDTDDTIPGTIVNISSMSGKHGMAMNADYAAAKAGVIGLTKSIALEFRWHNVRCNALLPGFTDTLMLQNTQKRILEELIHQVVPMRRLAQPEEIAKACLFLASEESSYIHGTCLEVAGGIVAPGPNKSIMSYNRMLTKRVLVTGGGNGIGRAICRLFAREGAEVAIMDINNDAAERTLALLQTETQSKHHCVIAGDVRKVDDIKRTFETAFKSFGQKPNILINNAVVLRYSGSIDVVSEDNMNDVIDINLKGVYMMAKYFIAQVKGSGDIIPATIVNIASMAGKVGMAMDSDYAASKAGVIGLTKSIALEYRWHKVRCNALLPGFTDTSMAANSDGHILHKIINHAIPMRRLAEPEEIANACLFLAGEESSYVNGACLEVAGGL